MFIEWLKEIAVALPIALVFWAAVLVTVGWVGVKIERNLTWMAAGKYLFTGRTPTNPQEDGDE